MFIELGPIVITPELMRRGYGKQLLDYSREKNADRVQAGEETLLPESHLRPFYMGEIDVEELVLISPWIDLNISNKKKPNKKEKTVIYMFF